MAFHLFYSDDGENDVLEKKKKELAECCAQYDSAIALVTGTVNSANFSALLGD